VLLAMIAFVALVVYYFSLGIPPYYRFGANLGKPARCPS